MIVTGMTTPLVFDRKLLAQRRRRARALGPETFLLERVTQELVERLAAVKRHFPLALDLGTPDILLSEALKASGQVGELISSEQVASDEEALPFARSEI